MMETDPVVAEVKRIRERLAAEFAYDVRAIGLDAQQRVAPASEFLDDLRARPVRSR